MMQLMSSVDLDGTVQWICDLAEFDVSHSNKIMDLVFCAWKSRVIMMHTQGKLVSQEAPIFLLTYYFVAVFH